MAHEPIVAAPLTDTTLQATIQHTPGPDHEAHLPPPSQEQIQKADGVFAHSRDSDLMAGLAGMWTGAMLLHDLAAEHFDRGSEEEELAEEVKREDEPTA